MIKFGVFLHYLARIAGMLIKESQKAMKPIVEANPKLNGIKGNQQKARIKLGWI